MRTLGVILHGPEVIDEGEAREAMELIKGAGFEVDAALGGITGKTAVIDAGLRSIIDISRDMAPSEVAEDFLNSGRDFIVLVNHAKSEESGVFLGEEILRSLKERISGGAENLSFVQIEYVGRFIIPWLLKEEDDEVYKRILKAFVFVEKKKKRFIERPHIWNEGHNLMCREIKGVLPNEKILINGVVIGISNSNRVTLVAKEGKITKIIGGSLIEHNLKKLPPLDLKEAMVKTAKVIRRTKPKEIKAETKRDIDEKGKKKACLFFTVENLFPKIEKKDVEVVVSIGDDTTSIAGDILRRFDVRLIGITDGDADGLIDGIEKGALEDYEKFLPEGSIIIRLKPERDDVIGRRIKEEIFKGEEEIELEFEDLKRRILKLAKKDIVAVLPSTKAESG